MVRTFNNIGLARRLYCVLLACVFLTACGSSSICGPATSHSGLVVFGDSYSDTGNIAVDNILEFPWPFHDGRFSNGLVAVDHLAAHLGAAAQPSKHTVGCDSGYNYAVGGGNIIGTDPQDFLSQVDSYLSRVSGAAEPSALYLAVLGGNDVRSLNVNLSVTDASAEIDQILTHLFAQLERLVSAGAVRIMLANSGDMGRLPGSIADSNLAFAPQLSAYSAEYNIKFDSHLADFVAAHPALTVTKFDLSTVMDDIIDNAGSLGFINNDEACFDADGPSFHPDCAVGTKFDEFVFFDSVHATAKTHQIIGQALIDTLP